MLPLFNYSSSVEPLLPALREHLPASPFDKYFEPFLGSGAMFLGMEGHRCLVNDKCRPLMLIYHFIKRGDPTFIAFATSFLGASRKVASNMYSIFDDLYEASLANRKGYYKDYRDLVSSLNRISDGITFGELFDEPLPLFKEDFKMEKRHQILQEVLRQEKVPELDAVTFETGLLYALEASVYDFVHSLLERDDLGDEIRAAALYFLLCANPSDRAEVSVNDFSLISLPFMEKEDNPLLSSSSPSVLKQRIRAMVGDDLHSHLRDSVLTTGDALQRLRRWKPSAEDFVFVDPPREVSGGTCEELRYSSLSHEQLALYLLYECPSKWMALLDSGNCVLPYFSEMNCPVTALRGTDKVLVTNYDSFSAS